MRDVTLTMPDRQLLTGMLRSTTMPQGVVRRARVILTLADGLTYDAVATTCTVIDTYIARSKRRSVERGLLALGDMPRSGSPDRLDPRVEVKILARTQEPPPSPYSLDATHGDPPSTPECVTEWTGFGGKTTTKGGFRGIGSSVRGRVHSRLLG